MTTQGWIEVGAYCECGHVKSDHEYSSDTGCAYGWSGDPSEEEVCPCEAFVLRGHDVVRAKPEPPR